MPRNYAALPYEYLEETELLTDEEFGRLMRALIKYSATGEIIELTGNERFFAKRVMFRENRYQESYERASAAGKKSAEIRQQKATELQQNPTEVQQTSTDVQQTSTDVQPNPTEVQQASTDVQQTSTDVSKINITNTNTETNTDTEPETDSDFEEDMIDFELELEEARRMRIEMEARSIREEEKRRERELHWKLEREANAQMERERKKGYDVPAIREILNHVGFKAGKVYRYDQNIQNIKAFISVLQDRNIKPAEVHCFIDYLANNTPKEKQAQVLTPAYVLGPALLQFLGENGHGGEKNKSPNS